MSFKILVLTAVVAVTFTGTAGAAELKQIARIEVPGEKLAAFDIGLVDQKTQRTTSLIGATRTLTSSTPRQTRSLGASAASSE